MHTITISFTEDEFLAVYRTVEEAVHSDDEYISNHDPIRIALLKLMKQAAALGEEV